MKWCLSNQFDVECIIYEAGKTELSVFKFFLTDSNNSVRSYLENTNKTTKTTKQL